MLIIDRTQRTWAALSIVTVTIASGVYVVYANSALNGPSGGSLTGLVFGIIAACMMIFAGLLAARRRFPAVRMGSAQFWLRGHLWIGGLTVPFALFHAGFGWGGRLELLLWILFFAVILSGFWGLALQQVLPRMMLEQLPHETFVEQIPHLCLKFTAESDRMLAEVCGPLEAEVGPANLQQLQPYLQPYFEEDRKKNRNDYPKSMPDEDQYRLFLAKVYAGVPGPAVGISPEPPAKPALGATPAMKSVAQVTSLPVALAEPSQMSEPVNTKEVIALEPATPKIKPDPKALLAAAKAKRELAAAAAPAVTVGPTAEASPPPPAAPVAKPDPKALLAAARAKKAAADIGPTVAPTAAHESPQAEGEPANVVSASKTEPGAKPDPRAMLAAAKAKREAAAASGAPVAAPTPAPQEPTVPEPAPAVEVTATAPAGKPDPRAMLAAAKAKREAAAGSAAVTPTVVQEAIAPASDSSPVASVSAGKPDPRTMLAAAKAKREAAQADTAGQVTPTPSQPTVPQTPIPVEAAAAAPPTSGKPDPKAMLAAMKAKKDAAAAQTAAPPSVATPAVVVEQVKAVKEPSVARAAVLSSAGKVAPPTRSQIAELKQLYLELVRPQLPLQRATREWMEAMRRSTLACRIRQESVHPQFIEIFDRLHVLCEQRRQFSFVQRYHRWLHGWLLVHIPATVALYVILMVHAVAALRVIPFGN